MPASTTMNATELERFFQADESRREWRNSLYEVILGQSDGLRTVVSKSATGWNASANPSSFGGNASFIPISDRAGSVLDPCKYASPVGNTGTYNMGALILPETWYYSRGQEHLAAVLYKPPQVTDVPLIGAFLRIYCGAEHATAGEGWWAPAGSARVVTDYQNAVFSIKETGKDNTVVLEHAGNRNGFGFYFPLTDGAASYGQANVGTERQINLTTIGSLGSCVMYATVHLVYAWQPGVVINPYMDWPVSTPDPVVVSGSESTTQTITFKKAGSQDANCRHQVKVLVTTESNNTSFQPLKANSAILSKDTTNYTLNWSRSLFNDFPNHRAVRGQVQMFTYMPGSDDCMNAKDGNGNPIPVTCDFEVALAVTDDISPVLGNVSAVLLQPSGFPIRDKYIQNKSSVRIDTSGYQTKLGATTKRLIVAYYGSTIYKDWPSGTSGVSVTIDTLDRAGDVTFSVFLEDSRGFVSSAKTVTIRVEHYALPTIPTCSLYRTDQNGTPNDMTGRYAVMNATAVASPVDGANSITQMRVAYAEYDTNIDWDNASYTVVTPGQDAVVATDCDPGKIYRFRIEATDTAGNTVVRYKTLKTAAYTLHLRKGGNGIGIGQVAHKDNALTIADDWDFYVYGDTLINIVAPVGCIRMFGRVDGQPDTDPAEIYPGTVWERITDRYLIAASAPDSVAQKYIGGTEGGANTFFIRPENVPQLPVETEYGGYAYNAGTASPPNEDKGFGGLKQGFDNAGTGVGEWGGDNYLANAWANHGNLYPTAVQFEPPFYAVDVWKRIL